MIAVNQVLTPKVTQGTVADEVVADLLLLGGGILLVVPGLLTDSLGLAVFIPAVRQECIQLIRKRMRKSLNLASTD